MVICVKPTGRAQPPRRDLISHQGPPSNDRNLGLPSRAGSLSGSVAPSATPVSRDVMTGMSIFSLSYGI